MQDYVWIIRPNAKPATGYWIQADCRDSNNNIHLSDPDYSCPNVHQARLRITFSTDMPNATFKQGTSLKYDAFCKSFLTEAKDIASALLTSPPPADIDCQATLGDGERSIIVQTGLIPSGGGALNYRVSWLEKKIVGGTTTYVPKSIDPVIINGIKPMIPEAAFVLLISGIAALLGSGLGVLLSHYFFKLRITKAPTPSPVQSPPGSSSPRLPRRPSG